MIEIIKYPDGSSYAQMHNDGLPYVFTFRINTYEDLWHLNQVVDAWNFKYGKQPTIIVPNLIDAQADRRFNDNESFGLKLVCNFLNGMNANFKIFHPHNPEVVEALMDNVEIINNTNFIRTVLNNLTDKTPPTISTYIDKIAKNLILMSSDAGGFKPLMKLCNQIKWKGETASCSKARYWEDGKSKLNQTVPYSDFKGKDILIIDDLCVYGGTFKGLATQLKEYNCGKLYLAVSHMTVKNLGNDPITNYFNKVFTTNSKFNKYHQNTKFVNTSQENSKPPNLEIIKIFDI